MEVLDTNRMARVEHLQAFLEHRLPYFLRDYENSKKGRPPPNWNIGIALQDIRQHQIIGCYVDPSPLIFLIHVIFNRRDRREYRLFAEWMMNVKGFSLKNMIPLPCYKVVTYSVRDWVGERTLISLFQHFSLDHLSRKSQEIVKYIHDDMCMPLHPLKEKYARVLRKLRYRRMLQCVRKRQLVPERDVLPILLSYIK